MLKQFSIILFLSVSLVSCGGQDATEPLTSSSLPSAMPKSLNQTAPPEKGEQIAVIKTNKGVIKFKFFPEVAPETVKNFSELAKKGYYDGLLFHRVIPGFMIQGGDPLGDGTGGETYKGPGTTLKAEFSTKLSHINGAVSMARKGGDDDSASSQFFIVENKDGATFLDNQYTIFGQVFEGFDVVLEIAKVKRDKENDKPLLDMKMEKVTIETY